MIPQALTLTGASYFFLLGTVTMAFWAIYVSGNFVRTIKLKVNKKIKRFVAIH